MTTMKNLVTIIVVSVGMIVLLKKIFKSLAVGTLVYGLVFLLLVIYGLDKRLGNKVNQGK